MTITEHSGSKYVRDIYDCVDIGQRFYTDVYSVLKAFNVTCPARQHAIKKSLVAGLRGKASELEDLVEAQDALSRAIEMEKENTP